jgi:hypothetical protein
MHFGRDVWYVIVGLGCIPLGLVCGYIGIARFRTMNARIQRVRARTAAR